MRIELFNPATSRCAPFLEIHNNHYRIYTSHKPNTKQCTYLYLSFDGVVDLVTHNIDGDVDNVVRIGSRYSICNDGWQTLDTAPKDDTVVDLWINDGSHQCRVPNCRRVYDGGKWPDVWTADGKYVNGSRYYDDGDDCFAPGNVPHPKAVRHTRVTHWRLPPSPPEGTAQ